MSSWLKFYKDSIFKIFSRSFPNSRKNRYKRASRSQMIGLLKVANHTKGGYRLYDREETLSIIRKIKPVVNRQRTLMQVKEDLAKKIKKRK